MRFQIPLPLLAASLLLLAVAFCVPTAHALKYTFDDEPKVCFVEEITSDTNFITGRYNWHDRPAGPINLNVTLYNPASKVIKSLEMKGGENIFAIPVPTDAINGAYLLCAEIVSPKNYKPTPTSPTIAVSFDVDQSYTSVLESPSRKKSMKNQARETINGMDVFSFRDFGGEVKVVLQSKEYLDDLQWGVDVINDQLDTVERNMIYALNREGRMRITSESTFTRVWIASLLTLGIMIATVYAQFHALKSIIIKKKLV
ncbi:unnamed protein product [Phytomonas sp. EM1]|nr:unnamed protein product [Phytomonas sp. EM1]|eukprot:CCW60078.1 unnamed protein product [Phytomonas sp. isolate EM1]